MPDEIYSIGKFAKLVGKSIRTLQRWDKVGILTANRTATGRRFYTTAQYHQVVGTSPALEKENRKNICYTRVSGNDQKKDLMSQRGALEQYIISNGIAIDEWLSDVGSGLNFERKNFNYLLIEVENNRVGRIIIAHKDRLVRFGYEWFEDFCKRRNCEIIVINAESLSPEEEVTKDLLTIIQSFSSRLYCLRRYKKEIEKMVVSHEND